MQRYFWGVLLVIGIAVAGCGKTPASKRTAGVNKDILSVQEADNALGQSTLSGKMTAEVTPAAANMVVNSDVGPLVEQTQATPSAAKTDAAAETGGAPVDKPDDISIQKALKNLGLYNGNIDGVMGPQTKEAIRAFQRQNNLEADGKVGPKTWSLLKKALDVPATAS